MMNSRTSQSSKTPCQSAGVSNGSNKTVKNSSTVVKNSATAVKNSATTVKKTPKPKMIDEDEFADSWTETKEVEPVKEVKSIKEVKLAPSVEDEFANSWNETESGNHDETKIESAVLSATVSATESSPDVVAKDVKRVALLERGEAIINEFKRLGIEMQGITSDIIIEKWSDFMLLEGANPNESYLRNLVKSILEIGYDTPRPIQCLTSGLIAKGGDAIVQAVAGNGKTAAFVSGAAARIDPTLRATQVVILSPTQILTDQTTQIVRQMTAKTGIVVHCYRGGLYGQPDKKVPHIIVACPGRLNDMIQQKRVNFSQLKTLILDEGDELLKQGFREQIKSIVESMVETVQICLFSATFPKGILEICERFMRSPSYVILPDNQVITKLVSQWIVKCVESGNKDGTVYDAICSNPDKTIIVFFNSCSRLQKVSQILAEQDRPIEHLCVHGKMSPEDRGKQMAEFKTKRCRVLLASDIAARGLDIPHVTLVINYDVPSSPETYVHRIGRAGRGDEMGNAITLVCTERDSEGISSIKHLTGHDIRPLKSIVFN
jgi:translation initiation factor 4A